MMPVIPIRLLESQRRFDDEIEDDDDLTLGGLPLPSLPQQDDWNRSQADLEVKQQRPGVDV